MTRLWQPPAFWWRNPLRGMDAVFAGCLAPFGWLYGEVATWRMCQPGVRAPLPVLCVGNLVVGGAGKTPIALMLSQRLKVLGETPWFLTRGYGSAAEHGCPVIVDPAAHCAEDVGDEALLLARVAPTIASADRIASARLAAQQGASLLILDDGLQNPALEKDLRLIVVDAEAGVGNGLCLPAGPLRAKLAAQLDFASALVIVGEGGQGHALAEAAERAGKPVVAACLAAAPDVVAKFAGRRVYAFAGIGRPAKFFATLTGLGAEIAGTAAFPDHYAYRRGDVLRLQRAAHAADAELVTTEKDFVRLAPWESFVDQALPQPKAVPVETIVVEPAALDDLVTQRLRHARAKNRERSSR